MGLQILFGPEARREAEQAVAWFERQRPGLGERFQIELEATLERIAQNPQRFRLAGKTVRAARMRIFEKYAIYYHIEPDFIGVVAVFHGSRNPAELQRRLG